MLTVVAEPPTLAAVREPPEGIEALDAMDKGGLFAVGELDKPVFAKGQPLAEEVGRSSL